MEVQELLFLEQQRASTLHVAVNVSFKEQGSFEILKDNENNVHA